MRKIMAIMPLGCVSICSLLFFVFCLFSSCITTCRAWTSAPLLATRPKQKYSNLQLYMNSKQDNKPKIQAMMNFIEQPTGKTVGDNPPPESIAPENDPAAELVRCIVKAADGRKAENIVALHVSPVSTLTTFLVILSGNSRPQNQAIASAIAGDVLQEFDLRPGGNGVPEGTAESGWMLLDFGSVIVHIMTPKSRLFYNIEGQWREKGGKEMDVSDIIVPNTIKNQTMKGMMDIEEEEDDPFWS